ncbi:hypothetical protein JI739_09725 [Ramlibacter sp. AW1]|uniref:Uncharacterized protein n=1 Tax=Ramlibacter aurantiacus TaxID=2801330 RepID=A0A937D768_9BURK|nr:hypothetical protein [Ramlibacter aurantiacus]MBL0420621.1 hypothetical protein [Ramlibacter aurantiacus]
MDVNPLAVILFSGLVVGGLAAELALWWKDRSPSGPPAHEQPGRHPAPGLPLERHGDAAFSPAKANG